MSWFRKFVIRRLKIPSSKSSSDFSKMIVLKIVNNVALTTKFFKFVLEIVLVILSEIAIRNHPPNCFLQLSPKLFAKLSMTLSLTRRTMGCPRESCSECRCVSPILNWMVLFYPYGSLKVPQCSKSYYLLIEIFNIISKWDAFPPIFKILTKSLHRITWFFWF